MLKVACSTGPNSPLASIGSTDPSSTPVRPTIASVNSRTYGWLSSRTFQTSATRPPGRSTRAISTSAGPWSNQWNACATVTTSALSAGSGIASAPPSTRGRLGHRRAELIEHLGKRLDRRHAVTQRDERPRQLARAGAEIDDIARLLACEPADGILGVAGTRTLVDVGYAAE